MPKLSIIGTDPILSPYYQLIERFYPASEAGYEERYQKRSGFWRPIL